VADDLRADFDGFLLPGIAANERVAGFIPIGQLTISAGTRPRSPLADIVTRF
jgi:hypothetical protein